MTRNDDDDEEEEEEEVTLGNGERIPVKVKSRWLSKTVLSVTTILIHLLPTVQMSILPN